jgi:hypothetical protein
MDTGAASYKRYLQGDGGASWRFMGDVGESTPA